MKDLSSIINHPDPRRLHSARAKYTFFSRVHRIFTKIGNTLGHKANLNTFKKTEILENMFYDYSGIKLEFNNKKIWGKPPKYLEIKQHFINNSWVKEEIKGKIGKYSKLNKNENIKISEFVDCRKSSAQREMHSIKHILEQMEGLMI